MKVRDSIQHQILNKLLILQWKLRPIIGKKWARRISIYIEHLLLH